MISLRIYIFYHSRTSQYSIEFSSFGTDVFFEGILSCYLVVKIQSFAGSHQNT